VARVASIFGERIGLTDQAGQFSQRIAAAGRRSLRRRTRFVRSIRSLIVVVSHSVPGCPLARHEFGRQLRSPRRINLAHFVRRIDPKQGKPGGQHGGNCLNQREPRGSLVWIILDNEA